MRRWGGLRVGLAALLGAISPALPAPVPEAPEPFDVLARELAAFVPGGTVNVAMVEFRYADSEITAPGSGLIENELALALERTGKFRVITRDRIPELMAEGKLALAKVMQSGEVSKAAHLKEVDALVGGTCFPRGNASTVFAELVWRNGGVANRAKIALESFAAAGMSAAPEAPEQSCANIADAKARVKEVPHDFELELLVAEGRTRFREGDVINYKVRSAEACHIAVLCHQVDGSTVVLFPNQHSRDTQIPAGKTIDVPGTSKHGFEVVIGPPFGSDVVQVIACTGANALHQKISEINQASGQSFASLSRAAFSEHLTRGMSVVAAPASAPAAAGPPRWSTDYVVVSTSPRH